MHRKIVLLPMLALVLALTACGASAAPSGNTATAAEDTITVTASGTVHLVPDKAAVTFGVTTEASAADKAQSENTEKVNQVIAVLTERGVEEKSIRTANYNMYPRYSYESNTQRLIGYTVCTTLSIQDQSIDDVGKLLSDCVAAGINQVDSVSFLCSTYDAAYNDALTQAVDTARQKAEVLARAAGKTLGDAVTVTEGWQNTSARYARSANLYMEEAMAADSASISLMPGETEIAANVTVTFRMQ